MTSLNYYYYIEVCKDMNFTVTARRLYVSQQSISRHIEALENYYQTRLFIRKPRLALTESGREVLKTAQLIFDAERQLKQTLAQMSDQSAETIVVASTAKRASIFLPAVMDKIWADYPNLSISRVASRSQLTVEDLLSGKVDFHIGYRNNMSSSNGLDIHDLMQDPVVFAISRSLFHKTFGEAAEILSRSESGVDLAVFRNIPFLANTQLSETSESYYPYIQDVIRSCFSRIRATSISSLDTMLDMCARESGIIYLSKMSLYDYLTRNPSFTKKHFYYFAAKYNEKNLAMNMAVFFRKSILHTSPCHRRFLDITIDVFKAIDANNHQICFDNGNVTLLNETGIT